jgi:predicted ATP-dependent protease
MSCSMVFEQSYGGVDGDSASSTEIYAILSAISGQALRQDVAVTGSVDQYGHVQAIGGVNEKIEGFYRVCKESKLTGSQGVMIPRANVKDLHLAEEVVTAVNDGQFHVWAVDNVSDGIELLTGRPAGVWTKKEKWTDDSIFAACQERLDEMVRLMRKAAKSVDKDSESKNESLNEIDTKSTV